MKSIGMNLIKYILFVFNFIFAVSGLAVLIVGAVVLANVSEFSHFVEGKITAPPVVLIVIGLFVFLVASLGCYGAVRENHHWLTTYAMCLLIIFIVELACGIAAVTFRSNLEGLLNRTLTKSIQRRSNEDMSAWNSAQRALMCCGKDSPQDWYLVNNKTIPASCCLKNVIDAETMDCKNAAPLFMDRYYQEGCLMKMKMRIDDNATVIVGVGIGIAFIEVIGIILACWLASAIKKRNATM